MTQIEQVAHLILLVGGNPLPDWVAARLMLKQQGTLILIHSSASSSVAKRLSDYLRATQGIQPPVFVALKDESDANEIFDAVLDQIKRLSSARVGLNYTGGTKPMAVHAYRAVEYAASQNLIKAPGFSYLSSRTHMMVMDPDAGHANRREAPVAQAADAVISLDGLFKLHQERTVNAPGRGWQRKAVTVMDELLKIHSTPQGYNDYKMWRTNTTAPILRSYKPWTRPAQIKTIEDQASAMSLELMLGNTRFTALHQALTNSANPPAKTWGEVAAHLGFAGVYAALEFAKFLDGAWLELHTIRCVEGYLAPLPAAERDLHDYGRNLTFLNNTTGKPDFEIDVALIRGHQLHFITCSSTSVYESIKDKLFEAWVRARQLGGDEARVALVCCSEDPTGNQKEIAEKWGMGNRMRVFGRSQLANLTTHLTDWLCKEDA